MLWIAMGILLFFNQAKNREIAREVSTQDSIRFGRINPSLSFRMNFTLHQVVGERYTACNFSGANFGMILLDRLYLTTWNLYV